MAITGHEALMLMSVNEKIAALSSLDDLSQRLADIISGVTGLPGVLVGINGEKDKEHVIGAHGYVENITKLGSFISAFAEYRELLNGEVLIKDIDDLRALPYANELLEGFDAELAIITPIMRESEFLGMVFAVVPAEKIESIDNKVRQLTIITRQVAVPVENALLYNEQKRVAQEALDSQKELLGIVETASDAFFTLDGDFRFTNANEKAIQLLNGERTNFLSAKEIISKSIWELFPHLKNSLLYNEFVKSQERAEPNEFEFFNEYQKKWLLIHTYPYKNGISACLLDITDQRQLENQLAGDLRFFESMDKVNEAIRKASTVDQMMRDVLDFALEALNGEWVYLMYPCDPTVSSWKVQMERTSPDSSCAQLLGVELLNDPDLATFSRVLLESTGVISVGPSSDYPLPESVTKHYGFLSVMAIAIYPKIGKPWIFGINQCSYPRIWSTVEKKLFGEISLRIADGLTSLLSFQDLQESELRFRQIFENSSDALFLLEVTPELHFRIIEVNPALERSTGLVREYIIGRNIEDAGEKDVADIINARCRRAVETGEAVEEDISLEFPAGKRLYHYSLIPARDANGRIYRIVGIARDITDLKNAVVEQQKLRRQVEKERSLLEAIIYQMPLGVIIVDAETSQAIYSNRLVEGVAGGSIVGVNLEENYLELIKKYSIQDVDTKELLKIYESPLFRALRNGETVENKHVHITRIDGSIGIFNEFTAPVYDQHGELIAAIAIYEDITIEEEQDRFDRTLYTINNIVNEKFEFEEVIKTALTMAAGALGSDSAAVFIRTGNDWVFSHCLYNIPKEAIGLKLSDGQAPCFVEVVNTRKAMAVEDVLHNELCDTSVLRNFGVASALFLPLILKEKVLGVISFNYQLAQTKFSAPKLNFANKLAVSLSLVLENVRLMDLTKKELSRTRLLQDVAVAATTYPTLENVAAEILNALTRHLNLKSGDIKLYDESNRLLRTLAMVGHSAKVIEKYKVVPMFVSGITLTRAISEARIMTHNDEIMTPEAKAFIGEVGLTNARYAVVPVEYRGRIVGSISLAFEKRRDFTENEINLFHAIAHITGQAIENAHLYEAERHIAHTLQASLLELPSQIEGIEYGHLYRSSTESAQIGGDFYDLFELNGDMVGIVIGDVSGKGIEATALTTAVKNAVKAHSFEDGSPARIMRKTNEMIVRINESGSFVSVFFAVLDKTNGRLMYCSAGHPPPIIKRSNGKIDLLDKHSPVVGAFGNIGYESNEDRLDFGDLMVCYTDGIIEARCDHEFYGEKRLADFIKAISAVPVEEIPIKIYDDMMTCTGTKLADDVAVLAISRKLVNDQQGKS